MSDSYVCRFLRSTLGLKVLMALSGAVLSAFVAGHVAGNLLVFLGAEKFNAYAHLLKSNAAVLWGARLTLLASVVVHAVAAVVLTRRSRAEARPVPYALKGHRAASFASRTMILGGPLLGLFVVYHLLHFTVGAAHPKFDADDPYRNVVLGFSSFPVVLVYLVSMAALFLHLGHGVWSLLQTLGVNRPNWEKPLRCAALAFGAAVAGGFSTIPLAVFFGLVK